MVSVFHEQKKTYSTISIEEVAGKEHWEEEHDVGICTKSDPQAHYFGLPRWMQNSRDSRSIGPYHAFGISHEQRSQDADPSHHNKANICAITD
jgi:hypothetical protein